MSKFVRWLSCLVTAAFLVVLAAQVTTARADAAKAPASGGSKTYSAQEIINIGHDYFGTATGGFAQAVEWAFRKQGRPNAYIVGEEGAGAFFGGLRVGEGWLHPKAGGRYKLYWQGPSLGIDVGANGSRVLVLVYNLKSPKDLLRRFAGAEGSAYFIGGFGVNLQNVGDLILAPIRTGVGARLGVNIGYLKYTAHRTWNPF